MKDDAPKKRRFDWIRFIIYFFIFGVLVIFEIAWYSVFWDDSSHWCILLSLIPIGLLIFIRLDRMWKNDRDYER